MGTLNIPASSLIYVDTSPAIYSIEKFIEQGLMLGYAVAPTPLATTGGTSATQWLPNLP